MSETFHAFDSFEPRAFGPVNPDLELMGFFYCLMAKRLVWIDEFISDNSDWCRALDRIRKDDRDFLVGCGIAEWVNDGYVP